MHYCACTFMILLLFTIPHYRLLFNMWTCLYNIALHVTVHYCTACTYVHSWCCLFYNTPLQTACCQFLKANVEYLRANHKKALKVLSSAPKTPIVTDAGECLNSLMFNNMGCIHYEMGKYHLASHYFRKAVDENDAALNGYPPLDRGGYNILSTVHVYLKKFKSLTRNKYSLVKHAIKQMSINC